MSEHLVTVQVWCPSNSCISREIPSRHSSWYGPVSAYMMLGVSGSWLLLALNKYRLLVRVSGGKELRLSSKPKMGSKASDIA